jgi:hypothetical protein
LTDANYYGINGEIYRGIGTGDKLVVAVRDFDETDFSTSNPLVLKIGNTPRVLSNFLRLEVNAGVNTFNAGGTAFATREIDYFVYLGWRASNSSIFLLVSRIPYATKYGDFSTTATDERYGAYTGTAPASTDSVVNIGRFNAILSAGAGYTWSLPATAVIINHPIFETRMLSCFVTISGDGGSAGTYAETVNIEGTYSIYGNQCHFVVSKYVTNKGSWSGNVYITLPFSPSAIYSSVLQHPPAWWGNGALASASKAFLRLINSTSVTFLDAINSSFFTWAELALNDWLILDVSYWIN